MRRFSNSLVVTVLIALSAVVLIAARRRPATVITTPTYNREIVRILQENCQSCHRPQGIAPFQLMTYQDARQYAPLIRYATQTGRMPPWKPLAGCGEFLEERRLTPAQIQTIARWVDSGAPEGDPAHLPPPVTPAGDWQLGQPDQIVEPADFWLPPGDQDSFRCFVVPDEFPVDTYVRAVDFRPYARGYVHHIVAYIDTSGKSQALDDADPLPGWDYLKHGLGFDPTGYVGIYLPNSDPFILPEGVAIKIPAGAKLILQVHYHPHFGLISMDRSQLGLYYSTSRVSKLLRFLSVEQPGLYLPAGHSNVEITAMWEVPWNIHLLSIGGHMHYIGRQIDARAEYPDGTERCLLDIDDWDLHWQGMYRYREPVPLPQGTRFHLRGIYDNSSANPRNPHNPPKDIRWGEEATAEMCIAYGSYTLDDENLQIDP